MPEDEDEDEEPCESVLGDELYISGDCLLLSELGRVTLASCTGVAPLELGNAVLLGLLPVLDEMAEMFILLLIDFGTGLGGRPLFP